MNEEGDLEMNESRSLLPVRYRPQDDHLAQGGEPYDVKSGLQRLTAWMTEDAPQDHQPPAMPPAETIPSEKPDPSPSRKDSPHGAAETVLSDVRFLTVAEVGTVMRMSKMTVYRLIHSGELEAIRVGRSFRVPEQAINQYLQAAFAMNG